MDNLLLVNKLEHILNPVLASVGLEMKDANEIIDEDSESCDEY